MYENQIFPESEKDTKLKAMKLSAKRKQVNFVPPYLIPDLGQNEKWSKVYQAFQYTLPRKIQRQ